MTSDYESLFEKQRTKQRILIQLDQTKAFSVMAPPLTESRRSYISLLTL